MDKTTNLNKYPIDFESLSKGDEFSLEQLENILGRRRDHKYFAHSCMALQSLIHERTGFTVKIFGDGRLRVLTDPEAAEHNRKLYQQHLRGLDTRYFLNSHVDAGALSNEQRKQHERTLINQSRYKSAIMKVSKSIASTTAKIGTAEQKALPEAERPDDKLKP